MRASGAPGQMCAAAEGEMAKGARARDIEHVRIRERGFVAIG